MSTKFVKTRGNRFTIGDKEIIFNGIGIGSWFNMEHFMVGLPGTDSQIRQTFNLAFGLERGRRILDEFTQDFMTEDDFAYLKSHNINLIRVPFRYNMFIDDNGDRVPDGYRYIDRLMRMAEKYEIYVLPDLHTAPGGQNPDWHSDNQTGYTGFWRFCALQDIVVDMWDDLSKHLSDEKYLLGYDVLNEPFIIPALLTGKEDTDDCATGARMEGSVQILRNFYHRVLTAVRKNDSNHIVFFEGDHFASDFNGLDDFEDPQVAFSFHFYPTVWYPDLYEDTYSREERKKIFREVLDRLMTQAGAGGRPILCGEAGYEIKTMGFERVRPMIQDTIDLFHERKLSFTFWSYKDIGFMGMVQPDDNTAWKKLADRVGKRWDHHLEMDLGHELTDECCRKGYEDATALDRYILFFRARSLYYPLEEKYILLPLLTSLSEEEANALPESFLFKNCRRNEEFAKMFDL